MHCPCKRGPECFAYRGGRPRCGSVPARRAHRSVSQPKCAHYCRSRRTALRTSSGRDGCQPPRPQRPSRRRSATRGNRRGGLRANPDGALRARDPSMAREGPATSRPLSPRARRFAAYASKSWVSRASSTARSALGPRSAGAPLGTETRHRATGLLTRWLGRSAWARATSLSPTTCGSPSDDVT